MTNEEPLSQEKSLEIIHQMIMQAKANVRDDGNAWLWWGSMIFLACISTYIFIEIDYEYTFLGWNIFGAITIAILLYKAFRKKKVIVRTYIDDLLRWVDLGFIVSMFIIIFSINIGVNPSYGFGYFLMIYAFLMLIQGGAMKFMPLILGAVVNWIGAIAVLLVKEFKYDMLISAAAVFIGYIIPGLILRAQYRRQ
jgi:hypothetical protein